MDLLEQLAERQIRQAQARGEFDDLPGAGRPLPPDDLARVPEHLRAGYRLLRNAGYLPPELLALRELREAEDLLARIDDPAERSAAMRRVQLLELHLQSQRGQGLNDDARTRYLVYLQERDCGD